MGGGLVDVWGLTTHGNVAEETVRMRLVAASGVGAGEFERRSASVLASSTRPTRSRASLSSVSTSAVEEHGVPGGNALQHLVRSGRASAARPARAYVAPKREAMMGRRGCWRSGKALEPVRARGSRCGRLLGGGRPNQQTTVQGPYWLRLRNRLGQPHRVFPMLAPSAKSPSSARPQATQPRNTAAGRTGRPKRAEHNSPGSQRYHPPRARLAPAESPQRHSTLSPGWPGR